MKKILVIAAHPDDEVLGLGGTVRKLVNEGHKVYCLILGEGITSRGEKRSDAKKSELENLKNDTMKSAEILGYSEVYFAELPDNRFDSVDLLDIIKKVNHEIDAVNPEIIYTHHYGDLNIDHRRTFEAVITACRPLQGCRVKEIYAFETPSSTEWNFAYGETTFKPNVFVDISSTVKNKLEAMSRYKSEIREYPHPRSLEALEIIAKRWGVVTGCEYAEAFELIRKID